MNQKCVILRRMLLRRYYKSAALGWFHPKGLHWAKVVTDDGIWRWIRADNGIRGKLLRNPPLHIYQTVMGFKSNNPPRGRNASGYLFGGSIFFDADIIGKREPFSIWKIVDAAPMVQELVENIRYRGNYRVNRVMFSGSRGIHVSALLVSDESRPISLIPNRRNSSLQSLMQFYKQTARSVGYWCKGWDWKVSADIWRVSRVPWSLHGVSSLRAIPLRPPFTGRHIQQQLKEATVFSETRILHIRTAREVPLFSFTDGETYGPFRRGWATSLPIHAAIHLIWSGLAKPREHGPVSPSSWFNRGWQMLFKGCDNRMTMVYLPHGGVGG
jgi:hypothetical protein